MYVEVRLRSWGRGGHCIALLVQHRQRHLRLVELCVGGIVRLPGPQRDAAEQRLLGAQPLLLRLLAVRSAVGQRVQDSTATVGEARRSV